MWEQKFFFFFPFPNVFPTELIIHGIELLSNPDKVIASVVCQSEEFIRIDIFMTLYVWTRSWNEWILTPWSEMGLFNADPKHHVLYKSTVKCYTLYSTWHGYLNIGTPKQSAYHFSHKRISLYIYQKKQKPLCWDAS